VDAKVVEMGRTVYLTEHLLALALTRHRALAATPWIALTEAALREPTT
jgi:hypothetical protein